MRKKNKKIFVKTEKTSFECGRSNMTRAEDSKHNFKFRWPKSDAQLHFNFSFKIEIKQTLLKK